MTPVVAVGLAAAGIVVTCGRAARRLLVLLFGFVGVPIGFTLHLHDLGPGAAFWLAAGTAAVLCASLDDGFTIHRDTPRTAGRTRHPYD